MNDPASASPASPAASKTGRPRRTDWQDKFLAAVEQLGNDSSAAKVALVDRETVRQERKRDRGFAARYEDAHEAATDMLEQEAWRRATVGSPVRKTVTKTFKDGTSETTITETSYISTVALMRLLSARRPERYRESYRVEQTGADGGPIEVELAEKQVEEAVGHFRAEVVRLADARAARAGARVSSETG